MGRAHVIIVPLVSLCQYSWENKKQCLHCSYQMNMIFYKSTRCPYPIILCKIMLLVQKQ